MTIQEKLSATLLIAAVGCGAAAFYVADIGPTCKLLGTAVVLVFASLAARVDVR